MTRNLQRRGEIACPGWTASRRLWRPACTPPRRSLCPRSGRGCSGGWAGCCTGSGEGDPIEHEKRPVAKCSLGPVYKIYYVKKVAENRINGGSQQRFLCTDFLKFYAYCAALSEIYQRFRYISLMMIDFLLKRRHNKTVYGRRGGRLND